MALTLTRNLSIRFPFSFHNVKLKHTIFDCSKVPQLNDQDIEESCVRGSGPGGQAVNKTSNAIILKHLPTGIVVKCHQTRSLGKNREIAREILTNKLDDLINGDMSVENQKQRALQIKSKENARKSRKLNNLKTEWKLREGVE